MRHLADPFRSRGAQLLGGTCVLVLILASLSARSAAVLAQPPPDPIRINTNFEGASLGIVEKLDDTRFRLHVPGQYDERGHNRQCTWYFFRMDHVRNRDLTLTLTDVVGEYNDKPGAVAMNADTVPVYSADGKHWTHFPAMEWDNERKEATLKIKPDSESLWVAHIPPYTPRDLAALLAEVDRSPHARVEVIGKSVLGRDLNLVTVTDEEVPDAQKKTLWLQARQHAWEAGTSYVMEGALRFLTSGEASARELRRRVVFKLMPMGDPDGCASGKVRFNANGFDVNRHWDEVDLRRKEFLERMPEIWYQKKAILAQADSGRPIDLLVNMHNTETGEYVDTLADDPASRALVTRFFDRLVEHTIFDPSKPPTFAAGGGTTNVLYAEKKIPVVLMELRIGTTKKIGRRPTVEDRLKFGRQIVEQMAAAVLP